ncbi:GMC family oxidoreductase [Jannaschia ovalis]|uniref:GMC family oxidoreductase N-terminal domain-containing protein n=1 Tax=Jannaschia ovalis TaxID=3038773 RepID=A0ABY8LHC2_9RHOB|nr:GMC family oxidoreductase N-terminal domain-containing protein [Jannaschia sp. GRR-S6-38]WGH80057.1 GMC family oxidoreductase N-terminal domain-containing protein [Jannaschia sp. GRR-S6-38]
MKRDADIVIVGGGSAGCVMAARLSADPQVSVLLLEAGGAGRNPLIHIPAALPELLGNRFADWDYATAPQPGLGGRSLRWPRGRALGGSSAINAMCYARGDLSDYDDWGHGWSGAEALHLFKASECHSDGVSQWHGEDGPLHVTRPDWEHPATTRFLAAGAQAGHARVADFAAPDRAGVGRFDTTTHRGLRCSAARAFLTPPVRARPNLTIRTGAQVEKVLFDGTRAAGLQLADGTVTARREVILCAGAVNSPQILMLSGVGPADHLRGHGLSVVLDQPEIGANLQDHLDICLMMRTRGGSAIGYAPGLIPAALRAPFDWLRRRSGLLASNLAEGNGFARSDPNLPKPDIQFHFLPALGENHGSTRNWGRTGVSLHACNLYPRSRGTIRLASADPRAKPVIDPGYLTDARDLGPMIAGGRMALEILEAPAFDPIRTGWHQPRERPESDADWERFICARAESIYHPVGTAAIGRVTDGEGRVTGLDGLRVVDASLMPTIVGGNTNAPVIMMAERIARRMTAGA